MNNKASGPNSEITFGDFIKGRREEKQMSLRKCAAELNMNATYLFDIEKGNRPAPEKKLDDFIRVLGIPESDLNEFYDLAGISRQNNFPDIAEYIGNSELARVALRTARDVNLTDSRWQEIINQMKNPTNGN